VREKKEKILLGKGEAKRPFFPEDTINSNIGFHFGLLSPKNKNPFIHSGTKGCLRGTTRIV